MSKKSEAGPVFVQDRKEFLSIWAIAHEWVGLDPKLTNPSAVPTDVRRIIDKVVIAYFREELTLRRADGYLLTGHRWIHVLFFLDRDFNRLKDCLTKGIVDVAFFDSLYVMRSEILHWCPKEFMEPPACWALPSTEPQAETSQDDDDDKAGWYERLTEQRRRRVACLELARHIWKQNRELSYEAVRTHPLLKQAGLHSVFSAERFKKWSREFAPDEVKQGGRPSQTRP